MFPKAFFILVIMGENHPNALNILAMLEIIHVSYFVTFSVVGRLKIIRGNLTLWCTHLSQWLVASYPGRGRRGRKRLGTNYTHMHQHFRDIYRKIVWIPLMKHVVMPRKENTDEIYGRQELQAKRNVAADRYHHWNIQNSSYLSLR